MEATARRRYQTGQLYLQGTSWMLRWRDDVVENGRTRRVRRNQFIGTLGDFPTQRLAQREADRILARVNSLSYRPSGGCLFAAFAARWEGLCLAQLKPSTARNYRSHLKRHLIPYFGEMPLRDITGERVQGFLAATSTRAKTKRNLVVTLQSLWRQARAWGYVEHDPFAALVLAPARPRERRYFTVDQLRAILSVGDFCPWPPGDRRHRRVFRVEPWSTFYLLAAETGLRAGELCALRAEDVDLERGELRVSHAVWAGKLQEPKSAMGRRVLALSAETAGRLRPVVEAAAGRAGGFLFATKRGTPWDPNLLVKRKLHPLLDALGIPRAGLHAFRHTNATLMDTLRAPLRVRQERLGHSDVRLTLQTYTHVPDADARRIAEELAALISGRATS